MQTKIFIMYFYILFLSFIFISCANIASPTGGEGKNKVPTIIKCSIDNETINFNKKEIEIEFNNYMNRTSVIENIGIFPKIKYNYKWKGKKLIIYFNENLLENTTYSFQITANYKDYYDISPQETFFIVFATGDNIDNGQISGNLIGNQNKNGINVFVYNITKINANNINYYTDEPDYKTIIGTNGKFIIPALKDGKYRIIIVEDNDKNGLITANIDNIGIPCFDPTLINGKQESEINIIINKELLKKDTINKENDINKIYQQDTITKQDSNISKQEEFLIVSGIIPQYDTLKKYGNILLVFYNDKEENIVEIDKEGKFKFDKAKVETYNILFFVDSNNNNKFDKGKLIPFEHCELFFPAEQMLKIRKNWNITDFIISTKYKFDNHIFYPQNNK